ncbi:MAG: phage protease [Sphingomonadaceae bacterium]
MTTVTSLALCAATPLAVEHGVPEWVHLLPASGTVKTGDGRGPYSITSLQAIMAASLRAGGKLVIDENHSTDLAAPKGRPAPARGWIVELQQRADGIWGKVEWTPTGQAMMAAKEYRGISPVIAHRNDGAIVRIERASLVNEPNFTELTALHSKEVTMNFMQKLAKALGLGEDSSEDAIFAAIANMSNADADADDVATATQAALKPFAVALGLADDAGSAAIETALNALKSAQTGDGQVITSLQAEVTKLTTSLNAMEQKQRLGDATRFVDDAIRDGAVGVKPDRETYISMHMENPGRTEKLIGNMPRIAGSNISQRDLPGDEEPDALELSAQAAAYQKKQMEAGREISFSAAVRAIEGGVK